MAAAAGASFDAFDKAAGPSVLLTLGSHVGSSGAHDAFALLMAGHAGQEEDLARRLQDELPKHKDPASYIKNLLAQCPPPAATSSAIPRGGGPATASVLPAGLAATLVGPACHVPRDVLNFRTRYPDLVDVQAWTCNADLYRGAWVRLTYSHPVTGAPVVRPILFEGLRYLLQDQYNYEFFVADRATDSARPAPSSAVLPVGHGGAEQSSLPASAVHAALFPIRDGGYTKTQWLLREVPPPPLVPHPLQLHEIAAIRADPDAMQRFQTALFVTLRSMGFFLKESDVTAEEDAETFRRRASALVNPADPAALGRMVTRMVKCAGELGREAVAASMVRAMARAVYEGERPWACLEPALHCYWIPCIRDDAARRALRNDIAVAATTGAVPSSVRPSGGGGGAGSNSTEEGSGRPSSSSPPSTTTVSSQPYASVVGDAAQSSTAGGGTVVSGGGLASGIISSSGTPTFVGNSIGGGGGTAAFFLQGSATNSAPQPAPLDLPDPPPEAERVALLRDCVLSAAGLDAARFGPALEQLALCTGGRADTASVSIEESALACVGRHGDIKTDDRTGRPASVTRLLLVFVPAAQLADTAKLQRRLDAARSAAEDAWRSSAASIGTGASFTFQIAAVAMPFIMAALRRGPAAGSSSSPAAGSSSAARPPREIGVVLRDCFVARSPALVDLADALPWV